MPTPFDVSDQLAQFHGEAPLFPLPNVVLFPHIVLPLHIFEPRYRRMVGDALGNGRWLAMALLQQGWELAGPTEEPAIHQTVCLGRISDENRLPDGRYYLNLQGMCRARVTEEVASSDRPYRVGRLALERDVYPPSSECGRGMNWKELLKAFRAHFPKVDLSQIVPGNSSSAAPLGALCDILAYAMKLETAELQRVLEELSVDRRCELLLSSLAKAAARGQPADAPRCFPPPFSLN